MMMMAMMVAVMPVMVTMMTVMFLGNASTFLLRSGIEIGGHGNRRNGGDQSDEEDFFHGG
jgi:hypothetical protein